MRQAVRLKHTFHCRIRDSVFWTASDVREEACQFCLLSETSNLRRFRLKCSLITSVSGPTGNVWIAATNVGGKQYSDESGVPREQFVVVRDLSAVGITAVPTCCSIQWIHHVCFFPVKALCWVLGAGSLWVDTVWELGDTLAIMTTCLAVFHQNCVRIFVCFYCQSTVFRSSWDFHIS